MKSRVIGIAGSSGAGKTTLAKKLVEFHGAENCVIISADNYYKEFGHLSLEERKKLNYDHIDSLDFARLANDLQQLKEGKSVEIPTYDFEISSRKKETQKVDAKKIIIIEGILVLSAKELAPVLDLKVFVKTDLDLCLLRRIDRDMKERNRTMESVIKQYTATVRPMYKLFIEPVIKTANIVVNNNLNDLNFDITPIVKSMTEMLSRANGTDRMKFVLFAKTENPTDAVTEKVSPIQGRCTI